MTGERTNGPAVSELFTLPDTTAVVVGAGRGIGRAVALLFADAGAAVVAADIDGNGAEATASAVLGAGGSATSVLVDVADQESVAELGRRAVEWGGRLDVLVNTAAIFRLAPFAEATVDIWDETYPVNLRGVFLTTQMAVRHMRESGGGSIVNFSSLAARTPSLFDQAHYDAEKAGVSAITRAAAAEFAADGIRVNGVVPGAVRTEAAGDYAGHPVRGPITNPTRNLLGRAGTPAELAAVALFLASPASGYITGQEIVADGGFLVG